MAKTLSPSVPDEGVGLLGGGGAVFRFSPIFSKAIFCDFFRNWVDFGRLWEAKMGSKIDFLGVLFRMRLFIDFLSNFYQFLE